MFERYPGQTTWQIAANHVHQDFAASHSDPPETLQFNLCADGAHSNARTAKLHSKFRSDLLTSMLDAERVLCKMVLFHCTTRNSRFPTFHPKH